MGGKVGTYIPVPNWLTGYRKGWLRTDAVAGLTVAAVVVPQAMAYAVIAGLPLEAGLYTAIATMLVYPLLGSSRPHPSRAQELSAGAMMCRSTPIRNCWRWEPQMWHRLLWADFRPAGGLRRRLLRTSPAFAVRWRNGSTRQQYFSPCCVKRICRNSDNE